MFKKTSQGYKVLIAGSLVSAVLGSIHAFSIFLEPLEAKFDSSRATVSLTYSLGLVFLTVAVLLGPIVYTRFRPATIYLGVSILATTGAAIAGFAENIALVWVGYSVLFGFANGLGYGFGLQFVARANPEFPGFAMGFVTAAYALGAVVAPYGFELMLVEGGFPAAMIALAAVLLIVGLGATLLVAQSHMQYSEASAIEAETRLSYSRIAPIWIAYCAAVFAGLMAIGHAAGLAKAGGLSGWVGPAVIAGFNLLGSLISGWLADRISHRKILTFLPLLSAISLATLAVFPETTLISLGIVGFTYGGTIATYPVAISRQFPGDDGPRAYGLIFTAWGAAGLVAPWAAGQMFDLTGKYEDALWVGSALTLLSALVALKAIAPVRGT